MFQDLQGAKHFLVDQDLIAEIDRFCSEYADLARWIRKDQKSMQGALRTAYGIIESVMGAIGKG